MLKYNMRRLAEDRDACRRRIEEAEAQVQVGLQRHRRRRYTIMSCNNIKTLYVVKKRFITT
jgi:hypothetical protein